MADLTTLANAKQWLNVQTASDDALITRLISAASDYIQTWLNRVFAIAAYTEGRNGYDTDGMAVKNYPITTVTSVLVDGISIPAATGATDSGYVVNEPRTMIYLRGYRFTRGRMNVTLNYSAGFALVPNEIEQACIELVGLRYKDRERIGITGKSMAGESITFSQKDFSDAIQTTLTNYKKVVLL
jgi:hypothetical protein